MIFSSLLFTLVILLSLSLFLSSFLEREESGRGIHTHVHTHALTQKDRRSSSSTSSLGNNSDTIQKTTDDLLLKTRRRRRSSSPRRSCGVGSLRCFRVINTKPLIKKQAAARKERGKENDRPSGASVTKPAERCVVFLVLLLFCLSVSLLDDG